jgi:hypothetical protein
MTAAVAARATRRPRVVERRWCFIIAPIDVKAGQSGAVGSALRPFSDRHVKERDVNGA